MFNSTDDGNLVFETRIMLNKNIFVDFLVSYCFTKQYLRDLDLYLIGTRDYDIS